MGKKGRQLLFSGQSSKKKKKRTLCEKEKGIFRELQKKGKDDIHWEKKGRPHS